MPPFAFFLLFSVLCDQLTNPPSGDIGFTSDGFVTTATYTCMTGYYLQGGATRTCDEDGSWEGVQPACCTYTCVIVHVFQYLFLVPDTR